MPAGVSERNILSSLRRASRIVLAVARQEAHARAADAALTWQRVVACAQGPVALDNARRPPRLAHALAMVRPARTLVLCAVAAFAALLLAASPAAAQGSNRAMFTASLNPLPNTTGVNLGGNGFARVVFNTGASNAPRGDNQFTLDFNNLARLLACSLERARLTIPRLAARARPWWRFTSTRGSQMKTARVL